MAIARITAQTATGSALASTVSATYPGATTAGNLLIACVSDNSGGNGDTIPGFTSATADIAVSPNTGGAIFYKVATGSETTITATNTGAGASGMEIAIYEIGGFTGTPTVDKTATGGGLTATASTGTTAATTAAAEYAIVMSGFLQASTFTSWSNSFALVSNVVSTGTQRMVTGELVLAATGTQTSTVTISASQQVGACIATFKGVASTTNSNFFEFM